jgi:signal transduction histidine kinase
MRMLSSLFHMRRGSLPARLLLLILGIVLITEILVFAPDLARERADLLNDRLVAARVAAMTVMTAAPGAIDRSARDKLLDLSMVKKIQLQGPGLLSVVLDATDGRQPDARIDKRRESTLAGIGEALMLLAGTGDRLIEVVDDSVFLPGAELGVVIEERRLRKDVQHFAGNLFWLSLLIAVITGGLLYGALLLLLLRPMRRITGSIAAFRADPEHATPLDAEHVSLLADDEMAHAGRELSAMQHELRAALWRNARLAALGTAVAKVSHDLRGILTPALLSAERLQLHTDPAVRRSGERLVEAVDRATDLVRRALDFAREGPPPPALQRVALAPLVDEVARNLAIGGRAFDTVNRVDPSVRVAADPRDLFRVLANLLRNAAEAGARHAVVEASADQAGISVDIGDDGPGLPKATRAHLFRPFAVSTRRGGSGLGLAIARDLTRAHGGDIVLARTGPGGTVFRLTLPGPERAATASPAALADTRPPEGNRS